MSNRTAVSPDGAEEREFQRLKGEINRKGRFEEKPAGPKDTMSVPEMRKLLGLKKTESYWLVHKNYFETIMVKGKMRVVISSFEEWYANQVKHRKVNGEPPGQKLRENSYSIPEIAEMLGIDNATAYEMLKKQNVPTFEVEFWKRIWKEDFEVWYRSQNHYRTAADRLRDRETEASSISMPDMARALGIPRHRVYYILGHERWKDCFRIGFSENSEISRSFRGLFLQRNLRSL